ncbi:SIS domain-containing protein [bacterium]|nr:SIS domain-containing protein [FCB group bacterium]MBL7191423.1 SIS domain-containing protein [bacterium]
MTDWPERAFLQHISSALKASAAVKKEMEKQCLNTIAACAMMIAGAMKQGKKVMFCGNGGSAADSQHLAAEFIVRLSSARDRQALPAIALTTDTSVLTACANDFGFDKIFARQIEALGNEGDVLVCISTSGNSKNVLEAAETAIAKSLKCIGFFGRNPGIIAPLMNIALHIPADDTRLIQEGHITAGHIIVDLVEIILFEGISD